TWPPTRTTSTRARPWASEAPRRAPPRPGRRAPLPDGTAFEGAPPPSAPHRPGPRRQGRPVSRAEHPGSRPPVLFPSAIRCPEPPIRGGSGAAAAAGAPARAVPPPVVPPAHRSIRRPVPDRGPAPVAGNRTRFPSAAAAAGLLRRRTAHLGSRRGGGPGGGERSRPRPKPSARGGGGEALPIDHDPFHGAVGDHPAAAAGGLLLHLDGEDQPAAVGLAQLGAG